MKPRTTVVMQRIIQQIRANFPFAMTEQELCSDTCGYGCPMKLLEYMDQEISEWEHRLKNNEIPSFKDIQKLSKLSQNIYNILKINNLVDDSCS